MHKEWLLLGVTVTATVAAALALIRYFAPGLLGIPVDLQVVQVDKRVVPFYENVFRKEDRESDEFILSDPYAGVRAKPLFPARVATGPNDLLGFRNRGVPNVADVVVFGDSQTYGINVPLESNWPSRLMQRLAEKDAVVYSMAVGGWGAVQYLYMFGNAAAFRPKVAIIAFHSGNDSLESFHAAYHIERWASLRPDPDLDPSNRPAFKFPPPREEVWRVVFPASPPVLFTPRLRLASNRDHPAIRAGYEVMAEVARRITALAGPSGIQPVFTIIPTKELAYAERLRRPGVELDPDYVHLVDAERANLDTLAARIGELDGAIYVDLVNPLQRAVLSGRLLYSVSSDGHLLAAGHDLISRVLAKPIDGLLPRTIRTLEAEVAVSISGSWKAGSPPDARELIGAGGSPTAVLDFRLASGATKEVKFLAREGPRVSPLDAESAAIEFRAIAQPGSWILGSDAGDVVGCEGVDLVAYGVDASWTSDRRIRLGSVSIEAFVNGEKGFAIDRSSRQVLEIPDGVRWPAVKVGWRSFVPFDDSF